jgi:arginine repressor
MPTIHQLLSEALATMTQVALAEELTRRGLPTRQPTISRWLSGRRPMRRATEIVLRAMLEAIQAEAEAD